MKITTLIPIAALILVFGCKSSSTGSVQSGSGNLMGTVGLYDSHGNQFSDNSGVLVELEGTSLSATSDAAGNWAIHNVPTQTYSVRFSKSGFGTVRNTAFTYVEGDTVSYGTIVYLYQPVTFTVAIDSVSAVLNSSNLGSDFGILSGHISGAQLADSATMRVYVLIGNTSNIVFEDSSSYFGGLYFDTQLRHAIHKRGSDLTFSTLNWEVCGPNGWVTSGKKVYLKAFALTVAYSPKYFDVGTGTWVYPNPVPSSALDSVVIP